MQKNTSKIISKNSGETIQRWELPNVDTMQDIEDGDGRLLTASPMTAEQVDKIQREAYQEAYDEGFAKGVADGRISTKQQCESLAAIFNHCSRPLQQVDSEVEEQLIQLVTLLTRQLVRREIKLDPGQIVAVVREALLVLPVNSRDVRILLHPEDVQIIKQVLNDGDSTTYWNLIGDPTLERGDCRIQTESSSIDATLERRLTSVIANMLGGAREQDASDNKPPEGDTA